MAKDSSPPDPFAQWRQWFDRSERELNSAFNELMSTEQFKSSQGKMMEAFLDFQRAMGERTQEYMNYANLASTSDISNLSERLDTIDARLSAIESHLGTGTDAASPSPTSNAPRPKRTRKPPSKRT